MIRFDGFHVMATTRSSSLQISLSDHNNIKDMDYEYLFDDDNFPPGSKRPLFNPSNNLLPRHEKRAKQQHIELPAPGMPPNGSMSTCIKQLQSSPPSNQPHKFLSSFPREVRNLIYKNLAALYTTEDHTLFIDGAFVARTPLFSPLFIIATSMTFPLILVNKKFLLEYVEELFFSGTVRFIGGPCVLHEFLHGQQPQMKKLHHIELQWEGMPLDLLDRIDHITDKEMSPLLDFIRLSTQIHSITIPLYFLERSGTDLTARWSNRRPVETRLSRKHRRQIPTFWIKFIYQALQNLLVPNSSLKEIIIRYHPYDMWTCFDAQVNAQNLLGKVPSEWEQAVSPDLCSLRAAVESDPMLPTLDEMFAGISVHERGEAEEGLEASIRFRKPEV